LECEKRVSTYLGAMTVSWIEVPDEPCPDSERGFIEKNAIALLSNQLRPVDIASPEWLGQFSPKGEIRGSSLWNVDHVNGTYDPAFLDKLELLVSNTCNPNRLSTCSNSK
jgi:hypothetical protein